MRLTVLPIAAFLGALAFGCNRTQTAISIPEVTIDQAAQLFAAGAIPVDANSASTRTEQGVVPNARLLSSSGRYDPNTELPQNHATKLVFYCGGTQCTASDSAARRALEAGYTDVAVMRAGIRGWREAGKPTQPQG